MLNFIVHIYSHVIGIRTRLRFVVKIWFQVLSSNIEVNFNFKFYI